MVMKHLELFSGIGGFRQAFNLLEKDFGFKTQTIGFSEIDTNATQTYKANFDTKNEIEIGDIVAFVHDRKRLSELPNFEILTGGFPCQAFSMMGKQKGFNDLRGNVFFQIIDIIKLKKPSIILLENVRNIMSHNKGETFETVIAAIKSAGYPNIYHDVFNSVDFGLAQKRNRVFILATKQKINFPFDSKIIKNNFEQIANKTSLLKQKTVLDVLDKNVDRKFYLSSILKPTILSNGSKGFNSKSEINQIYARPLTATMVKMHRACQDNYYSDDFIKSSDPIKYLEKQFTKEELAKHEIRKITPKEAFLLQGFNADFFTKSEKSGVSNHQLYKQAGNAVSVNTVYAILHYLLIKNKLGGN